MKIKALTLWEPWATLVRLQIKTYETRSWGTDHRGWLAIHAARKTGLPEQRELFETFRQDLETAGYRTFQDLPLGHVVTVVRLIGVYGTELTKLTLREGANDWLTGDFSDGRYAWMLNTPLKFDPVPAKGHQGLWWWEVPEQIEDQINKAEFKEFKYRTGRQNTYPLIAEEFWPVARGLKKP